MLPAGAPTFGFELHKLDTGLDAPCGGTRSCARSRSRTDSAGPSSCRRAYIAPADAFRGSATGLWAPAVPNGLERPS